MALNIGIRSDIPLSDAYSDLSNRFSTGKSMTGGAGGGGGAIPRSLFGKGHCFIGSYKIMFLRCNWQLKKKLQNNVSLKCKHQMPNGNFP